MKCVLSLLATLSCFSNVCASLWAADFNDAPHGEFRITLHASDSNDPTAIQAKCEADADQTILCQFVTIRIAHEVDPEQVSNKIEKALAEIDSNWKANPSSAKDIKKGFCGDEKKLNEMEAKSKKPSVNIVYKQVVQSILAFCNNPGKIAFKELAQRSIIAQSRTCLISVVPQEPVKFTRSGLKNWIATVSSVWPHCNTTMFYELETIAGGWVLWKLRITRLTGEPRSSDPECSPREPGRRYEYSSLASRSFETLQTCESVAVPDWYEGSYSP